MSHKNEDLDNTKQLKEAVAYIKTKISYQPKVFIIGGSGLCLLADIIQDPKEILFEEIPLFPASPAEAKLKKFIFGTISNVKVMFMKGRFHYYEGLTLKEIILPVRLAKLLGSELMIVTNAAGGVNPNYKTGDIMIIKDHINFIGFGGNNPLKGPNNPEFGDRFFPVNNVYDQRIIKKAKSVAKDLAQYMHEGVYAQVGGPNYESIAEIKALRILGVDAVGMSTIPEVLAAAHCKMKVFGFSLISNECIADYDVDRVPNHEEVLKAVRNRAASLKDFLVRFLEVCHRFLCHCPNSNK